MAKRKTQTTKAKSDRGEKPQGRSKYALKQRMAIESTHPHVPRLAWCALCAQEDPSLTRPRWREYRP